MFYRRKNRPGYKAVISLILCTALTLNVGCQSTNYTTRCPQKDNVLSDNLHLKAQEVQAPRTQAEKPPQETNGFNDTLEDVEEFVWDAAEFTGRVVLVGVVVVGSMYVDYQMWRLADKMF